MEILGGADDENPEAEADGEDEDEEEDEEDEDVGNGEVDVEKGEDAGKGRSEGEELLSREERVAVELLELFVEREDIASDWMGCVAIFV